jgi:hypothetical protein
MVVGVVAMTVLVVVTAVVELMVERLEVVIMMVEAHFRMQGSAFENSDSANP